MTANESIIYQLKSLKGKSAKQKLEHIVRYFGIPILIVMILLSFTLYYLAHIVNTKPAALTVTCINSFTDHERSDAYIKEYIHDRGINSDDYDFRVITNMYMSDNDLVGTYASEQLLVSQIMLNEIDVVIADVRTLSRYFYQEMFSDLANILPLQMQKEFEHDYLYVDMAILREMETNEIEVTDLPDPTKPELMNEPVAVALVLPKNGMFQKNFYPYVGEQVAASVVANSVNKRNACSFLDYLMD